MRRIKPIPGSIPLFAPESDWVAPNLSDLPDWSRCRLAALDAEFQDDSLRQLGNGARRGAKLAGYSFALEGDSRGYYIPLRHPGPGNVDCDQGLNYLRDNLWNLKGTLVGANMAGDLDIFFYENIKPNYNEILCKDIQVRDPLIWEHHYKYSLEVVAERWGFKGKDEAKLKEAAQAYGYDIKSAGWKACIPKLPAKFVGPYGEHDAFILLPIYHAQQKVMDEQGLNEVDELEARLLPLLLKMRQRGIRVNFDHLDRVEKWALEEETKCVLEIKRLTGWDIGISHCMAAARVAPALQAIGITPPKTAETEAWSIKADWLATIEHPVAGLIRQCRQYNKLRTTFASSVRRYQTGGRVHPTFRQIVGASEKNEQSGAAYGRLSSCVAKGTLVEIARDVSKYPKGIPIQDVKVGDYAYTYDDELKLRLRKVTAVTLTGHRQVVRIHWRGYGGKHSGHTDVTPEHLIRLTTGEYVRADSLKPLDHVMALSRGVGKIYGYARIWPTGMPEIPREHRFIHQEVYGFVDDHVHHLDENKLNNHPSNLQALPRVEHLSLHAQDISDEVREKRRVVAQYRWDNNVDGIREKFDVGKGEDHPCWLGLSHEEVRKLLEDNYWSLTNAYKNSGISFETLKKYVLLHGFDIKELKKLNMQSRKERGVNPFNGKPRRKSPEKINNHQVVSIEYLQEPVDVYDLTIEETHNFIAGEICVHNCHLNIQQQPSRAKFANFWRSIYIPEEGCQWVSCDYSGVEPRWYNHFSQILNLPKAKEFGDMYKSNPRLDRHQAVADLTGLSRKDAKTVGLGLDYRMGSLKLAHALKMPTRWLVEVGVGREREKFYFETRKEALEFRFSRTDERISMREVAGEKAQGILDTFFNGAPFIPLLAKRVEEKAKATGFIRLLGGRVLHFPMNSKGEYDHTYKACSKLIQGSAAYQMKLALLALDRDLPELYLNAQIHDEIWGSVPDLRTAKRVNEIMVNVVKLKTGMPFRCDVEVGPSCGELTLLCFEHNCTNFVDPIDKFGCDLHKLVA